MASSLAWTKSLRAGPVPLAFILSALVAVVLEVIVLRPLYRSGPLEQVLATFGLTLFFNEAVTVIWGREPIRSWSRRCWGARSRSFRALVIQCTGWPSRVSRSGRGCWLYLLITRTRVGALIRAGSDNREIVAALGINISLLYTLVFALSAMLAALAGIDYGATVVGRTGSRGP